MAGAKRTEPESEDDCVEVCSLPPADLRDRVAMIRREILPLAVGAEKLPNGRTWTFVRDPALLSRLESLIAFERRCCGGLEWSLEVRGETIRLRVEGIDPDGSFLALLGEPTGP